MSKEELKNSAAAIVEIDAARASIPRLRAKAEWCAQLGLTVLSREYYYYAAQLEEKIEMQVKAIKGQVPDGFK